MPTSASNPLQALTRILTKNLHAWSLRLCGKNELLTFNSLAINDVDPFPKMLTLVLTFKLLILNVVALVDLYMRYMHFGHTTFNH